MNEINTEFKYCCNNPNKIRYNIMHNPKPIDLIPELRESIERLLWYVPGIESVQSYENYLIDNPLYSEAVFDVVLENMQMSRIQDVKIVETISASDKEFYDNEICTSCQKMILTRVRNYKGTGREETITRAMLRHLRNSIAHGSFTVVDNLVFFRDIYKGITKAIIKIDVLSLDRALKQIEDYNGITQEIVIAKVFEKLGFNVEREVSLGRINIDMVLKKNDKTYAVEIKQSNQRTLGYQDNLVKNAISQLTVYKAYGLIPIFIYDKMRASDRAKELLKNEGIILLDRKDIGELVKMNDIIS